MSVIAYLIILAASGLLIGTLARLALPGADPMTVPETMLVGITGSLIAGLIARLLFGSPGAGILLSVLAATGIVYLIRRHRDGAPVRPYGAGSASSDTRAATAGARSARRGPAGREARE